jgi:ATP-dependent helicase/nuclease subunit A
MRGSADSNHGSELSNAVRIVSIHKSKGLEFPIVFLSNTGKEFNYMDIRKNVVFHIDFGIGTMYTDKGRRIQHSTLAMSAIRHKLTEEMLSEELRVLYVAMTRAQEKLIITATQKNAERTLEKIALLPLGKVPPQAMMSLPNSLEWILAGLRDFKSSNYKINILPAKLKSREYVREGEHKEENERGHNKKLTVDDSESISSEEVPHADFSYSYPYQAATELPSKLTVTGMAKLSDPEAEKAVWTQEAGDYLHLHQPPAFISDKQTMTAAERGILIHLVMQHVDYETGSDEHYFLKELQRLAKTGVLTQEQIEEVDIQRIKNFFKSSIGGRLTLAKNISREFKFSVLRPAGDYYPGGGDDKILLQGVVDCYFEEDGELVVVDFKTDKVTEATITDKAQTYAPQLAAYADALEKITGKHVKEKIIYFFSLDNEYTL